MGPTARDLNVIQVPLGLSSGLLVTVEPCARKDVSYPKGCSVPLNAKQYLF